MLLTTSKNCKDVACTIADAYGSELIELSGNSDVFLAVISCNITRILCEKNGSMEKLSSKDKNAKAQVKCLSALDLHNWLEIYQTKVLGANKSVPL